MEEPAASRRLYLNVFVCSVFMLFLEILLIRWISTEIRIFAYFKNLTLIGCFLGIGLGCLLADRRKVSFLLTYPIVLVICGLVMIPQRLGHDLFAVITEQLGAFNELSAWTALQDNGQLGQLLGALLLLLLLFGLICASMIPVGHMIGSLMSAAENKIAVYSVNIAGSLIGVWLFSLASYLELSPLTWFAIALVLGLVLLPNKRHGIMGAAATALILATVWPMATPGEEVIWSPYQKMAWSKLQIGTPDGRKIPGGLKVRVNEAFHQRAVNYDPAFLNKNKEFFPELPMLDYLSYNLVYRAIPKADDVLVVGAGTGNDVAAALRNGAKRVDAVEIDPAIAEVGLKHHPEHPYSDPRVNLVVDDARSYFRKTNKKYDVIVFGALDSHTLNSSLSNIRIDNFVYTVDSFREARNLLKKDGVVSLVFSIERPFIGERLYAMLKEAFGHAPITFNNAEVRLLSPAGGGPTYWIDRDGALNGRIQQDPRLSAAVSKSPLSFTGEVDLATDDWPYLYLEGRTIPRLYLIVISVIMLLSALTMWPLAGGLRRINLHFLLLGAGFLLQEVQAISKLALIFGTTWFVNSIVISAVLTMILLANMVAARFKLGGLPWMYGVLAGSLLLNYFFPFELLLPLAPVLKALLAGAIMGLPIFFAGLVFIKTFAREKYSAPALGANLFGSLVGGLCESFSFLVGINALGLIALTFYLGSLLIIMRKAKA